MVRWKMVCKCKMGHCTLLNFYCTWISYRVTLWLFPPCSSHNSTCLTFPSSLTHEEQVPLCGREATLQNFRNTFQGRLLLRHTQEISNTCRYQEVNRPQDLIIQELPTEEQREFFIKRKKNSKSFCLLTALRDKNSLSNQTEALLLTWVGTQKNHKD